MYDINTVLFVEGPVWSGEFLVASKGQEFIGEVIKSFKKSLTLAKNR